MARPTTEAVRSLDATLRERTAEADPALVRALPDGKVRCLACGHRCLVYDGRDGICRVRWNEGGKLFVPRGYVAGLQVDPIEKKPFFHAFPGADALSFGMLGCDLHCGYCQNWLTSQALRDPGALAPPLDVGAADLVDMALRHQAPVMVSTYNEPLITTEWALEVFRLAKARGITCGFVSNGNATPEVLDLIRPFVDLYKVDLKSFRDRGYRELGGTLENVLETLRGLYRRGFWIEVVTLLVPGFNDSPEEIRDVARFLAGLSPDIPWHVTAFHADYRMEDHRDASARDLLRASEIGREEGLRFVYAGNRPGAVGDLEDTRCPSCQEMLVRRRGYLVREYRVSPEGACPACRRAVPGVWRRGWTPPASDPALGRRPRALPVVP